MRGREFFIFQCEEGTYLKELISLFKELISLFKEFISLFKELISL